MTHRATGTELRAGSSSLTVDVERGGRLSSLRVGDEELLLTTDDPSDRSIRWGSFPMAPWAGRLRDGILDWEGRRYQLRQTLGRHAIHGVVWDRAWTVDLATSSEIELSCALEPAGWPLGGLVRQRIQLEPDGVRLVAEIVAERSMPAALGWHPWFRRRSTDARLRVDADEILVTRGLIPTGQRTKVRGMTDLRRGPAMAGRRLDHAYVDVRSPAVVTWPDLELTIEFEPPASVVVVHTPPRGFCVEPQTAWPDAFSSELRSVPGTGLTTLGPGETLRAAAHVRWRALGT